MTTLITVVTCGIMLAIVYLFFDFLETFVEPETGVRIVIGIGASLEYPKERRFNG